MQYIGARYVPIWYVNSVDQTANWEVNVEYEPLTWVTTPNNHLYLSKKTVPDNIGTPAENTLYWLDMGVITGGGGGGNQEQIDHIRNGIAPDFDINDPYFIGDLVFYNGELYVYASPHTAGNDWNSSEVLHTSINSIIETMQNNLQDQINDLDERLDDLEEWEDVFCVIRQNNDQTWSILNDSGHEPKHVSGVSVDSNGFLVIQFDKEYSKVGTGIIVPDETYATQKITGGVSVATDSAKAYFAQGALGGAFTFNGTSCDLMSGYSGDISSVAWSSSQAGFEVTLAGYAGGSKTVGASIIVGSSGTAGATVFNWKVRLVSNSVLQFIPEISITGVNGYAMIQVVKDRVIDAHNMIPYSSANFWYYGKMKV